MTRLVWLIQNRSTVFVSSSSCSRLSLVVGSCVYRQIDDVTASSHTFYDISRNYTSITWHASFRRLTKRARTFVSNCIKHRRVYVSSPHELGYKLATIFLHSNRSLFILCNEYTNDWCDADYSTNVRLPIKLQTLNLASIISSVFRQPSTAPRKSISSSSHSEAFKCKIDGRPCARELHKQIFELPDPTQTKARSTLRNESYVWKAPNEIKSKKWKSFSHHPAAAEPQEKAKIYSSTFFLSFPSPYSLFRPTFLNSTDISGRRKKGSIQISVRMSDNEYGWWERKESQWNERMEVN